MFGSASLQCGRRDGRRSRMVSETRRHPERRGLRIIYLTSSHTLVEIGPVHSDRDPRRTRKPASSPKCRLTLSFCPRLGSSLCPKKIAARNPQTDTPAKSDHVIPRPHPNQEVRLLGAQALLLYEPPQHVACGDRQRLVQCAILLPTHRHDPFSRLHPRPRQRIAVRCRPPHSRRPSAEWRRRSGWGFICCEADTALGLGAAS